MSKHTQMQEKEIEAETAIINTQLLPKTEQINKQIKDFHSGEIKQMEKIIRKIEDVEDTLRDKQEQCETCINQINNKRKDEEKMGKISVGVLEAKSEEIKSKVKNIDAVSSGIKETVSKIKPQKLRKLPVNDEGERMLKRLFSTVYETLYAEQKSVFQWQTFKKLALKHERGQDFIFRLVNVNFKDLSNHKYEKLLELKADPEFEHTSINSKYAYDIIDLSDWVEYVCLGHQFSVEKRKCEKDYEKIRKDVDKKSKSSLQMSENFWREASSEIQTFQTEIQTVTSQLKAIIFGLKKSIEESQELEQKQNEKIEQIQKSVLTSEM